MSPPHFLFKRQGNSATETANSIATESDAPNWLENFSVGTGHGAARDMRPDLVSPRFATSDASQGPSERQHVPIPRFNSRQCDILSERCHLP